MAGSGRSRRSLRWIAAAVFCCTLVAVVLNYKFSANCDNFPVDNRGHSLLSDDGLLRDCATGTVIDRVRDPTRRLTTFTDVVVPRTNATAASNDEQADKRSQTFREIFERKTWGVYNDTNSGIGVSGFGSSLSYTHHVMAALHAVINELKRKHGLDRIRLLDMPCGDMGWMSRFLEIRVDVDYTGVDIVKDLIERHRSQYAWRGWKFVHLDFVDRPIPFRHYHLILCRMALQHLPLPAVLQLISRMSVIDGNTVLVDINDSRQTVKSAPETFLLTTTFRTGYLTRDVITGEFRGLNLEIPPLALRQPLCLAADGPRRYRNFLGLWPLPLTIVSNCNVTGSTVAAFGERYWFHSCTHFSHQSDRA